jgi:hypothetical protein
LVEYDATAATGLRAAQGYTLLKLLDYLIPPSLVWFNIISIVFFVLLNDINYPVEIDS